MEWQPIETAPKDGTWIMTIIPGFLPSVVRWQMHFDKSRWYTDPEDHHSDECFRAAFCEDRYEPTHWMPLPKPPTA